MPLPWKMRAAHMRLPAAGPHALPNFRTDIIVSCHMTRSLSISIPHRLTQEEARRRIQSGIADARNQFVGKLSSVEDRWTDNHLDFKFAVMSQSVTGRLDVLPNAVNLTIDLPWLLAALADKLKPDIERRGRKLLE